MTIKFIKQLEGHIKKNRLEEFLAACSEYSEQSTRINDNILMLSARLQKLNEEINRGTLGNEESEIRENQIRKACMALKNDIKDLVEEAINKSPSHESKAFDHDAISIINKLPSIVAKIVSDNQDILADFFTDKEDVESIMDKTITLYYGQKNQQSFTKWITILEDFGNRAPEALKENVSNLVYELKKIKTTLYSDTTLHPKRFIKFKEEVEQKTISEEDIEKLHTTILDRLPPKDAKDIAAKYLSNLKKQSDKIATYCTKIELSIKHGK